MDRRTFLKQGCSACLALTAVGTLITSCASTRYISGELGKDGVTVRKDDFLVRQKGGAAFSSFIIIRNEALQYPICLFRINDREFSALWMRCSHQGAELQASGDVLQCPAHGSEFDRQGIATSGPATDRLRSFPVRIDGNNLFIDLRKQV
ncbi:Rieske (2Fe-2S) protein [Flaviaesturariibacter amylovorans]|uniref:Rieske (2Fe-2S) protein n=1 Tax=Flaviaesturariibacter amylovorans TaxID=1084520 RepID=UPI0031EC3B56